MDQTHKGHLPHDLDSERSVLLSMMTRESATEFCVVTSGPEDFFLQSHRLMFRSISRVYREQGGVPDFVRVVQDLREEGELEVVGGASYVSSIGDALPDTSDKNLRHHAETIRRHANDRAMIEASNFARDVSKPLKQRIDDVTGALENVNTQASKVKTANEMAEEYDAMISEGRTGRCVETGLGDLDELLVIRPGNIVTIAAGPGEGKTTMALQIATHVAKEKPVLFVSLEMSTTEIMTRLLVMATGASSEIVENPTETNREITQSISSARDRISNLKMRIMDEPPLNIPTIAAAARETPGLALICIDYIQLASPINSKTKNRQEQVAEMSREVKEMAMRLNIPVVLVSQLSRAYRQEGRDPELFDLRESGSLEQDANSIVMLSGPSAKSLRQIDADVAKGSLGTTLADEKRGMRKLFVRKQRMGRTGYLVGTWNHNRALLCNVRFPT